MQSKILKARNEIQEYSVQSPVHKTEGLQDRLHIEPHPILKEDITKESDSTQMRGRSETRKNGKRNKKKQDLLREQNKKWEFTTSYS